LTCTTDTADYCNRPRVCSSET